MWLVHVMRFLLEWRQGCCGVGNTTAGPVYDVHCASYYLFFILTTRNFQEFFFRFVGQAFKNFKCITRKVQNARINPV